MSVPFPHFLVSSDQCEHYHPGPTLRIPELETEIFLRRQSPDSLDERPCRVIILLLLKVFEMAGSVGEQSATVTTHSQPESSSSSSATSGDHSRVNTETLIQGSHIIIRPEYHDIDESMPQMTEFSSQRIH